jgi:hypothetical protein
MVQPTPALVIDLNDLYKKQFGGKPFVIGKAPAPVPVSGTKITITAPGIDEITPAGSKLREQYLGIEIFLPIRIYDETGKKELMYLPYCVVRVTGKNNYISTPMIDRKGAVHELANSEDYSIEIKGFLIGKDRKFPEADLNQLKALKDATTALVLDNAITNVFLTDKALDEKEQRRVVITDFELPEVQGGREHVRPFILKLLSDTVFDLEEK